MAYYDKQRGRWRANFSVSGKRTTEVLLDGHGKPFLKKSQVKDAIYAEKLLITAAEKAAAEAGALSTDPRKKALPKMFGEAVFQYLETLPEGSGNRRNRRDHLARILRLLPADTKLSEIDEGTLTRVLADLRKEPLRVYVGGPKVAAEDKWKPEYWRDHPNGGKLSEQSVHHHMISIGAVLGHSVKLRALDTKPEMPKASPPDRLPNPIRPSHLKRLIEAAPQHLRDGLMIGSWLPARQREIWGMKLRHVDLEDNVVRFDAETSKNREGKAIPIAKPLRPVLERLVAEAREAGREHLLVWAPPGGGERRPIKHPRSAWEATLKRAGLENAGYRLHDCKGHFTTELLRKGVHPHVVRELSRQADLETTLRYVRRMSTDNARDAIGRLEMDAA